MKMTTVRMDDQLLDRVEDKDKWGQSKIKANRKKRGQASKLSSSKVARMQGNGIRGRNGVESVAGFSGIRTN